MRWRAIKRAPTVRRDTALLGIGRVVQRGPFGAIWSKSAVRLMFCSAPTVAEMNAGSVAQCRSVERRTQSH